MDILRKILYALIGVLVIVVAAGGSYLVLTGGHGSNQSKIQQTAQQEQPADQNKPQSPATNGQQNQTPGAPAQQPQNHGTPGQQSGTQGQQPQAGSTDRQRPSQVTGPNGQQPAQAPPILYPAAPPVRTIDPDPYYDRLNKAQEVIEEANKMITVDTFADTGSKDPAGSGADMSKLHQGIYKMSQGMTVMQETLNNLNKDIKGDAQFGPNPNQPAYSGYYPYQGYYQPNTPYGYNPQYPYNQVPGIPYQQQPQPGQSQPGNQTDTGQPNNQQLQQTPGNQPMNHGTNTASPLGNVSLKKLITYIAYGILAASITGVFVAILGMVNSMFKKPDSSQS
jgi:hypothetical protein